MNNTPQSTCDFGLRFCVPLNTK